MTLPSLPESGGAHTPTWRGQRIVTSYICPPVPVRDFDWSAVLEG